MTTWDDQGRPEPPGVGGEVETLLAFLDFQRATLAWKTAGVGADGLRARLVASPISLGGLLKHLAWVEYFWLSYHLHGHDEQPPWAAVNWSTDGDWTWESAAADSPEELTRLWEHWVAQGRELTAAALATGGLDQLSARPWPDREGPTLRWILVHLIEEYARHLGHADLLREAYDGATGD